MIEVLKPVATLFPMVEGREYIIRHKRKGEFRATFLGWENGDTNDPGLVRVNVPTGKGSGQERLANAVMREGQNKKPPAYSEKLLRPSLIQSVEEVKADGRN